MKFFKKAHDTIDASFFFRKGTDISYKRSPLNLYGISLYLNRAINKRADKLGEIDFVLKDLKGNEIQNEWSELLRRPNNFLTGDQFWKLYQKYKDIFGECYIWKEPRTEIFKKNAVPNKLHLLRPDLVTKNFNADKTEIISFTYNPENGVSVTYPLEEVIYSYNPDPANPLNGESLIKSGIRSLEVEIQASEYQAKSIKSGGNVDTVIKVKEATNKDQLDNLRQEYRKLKDEMWNNGTPNEPMFAGGDIDILRLALSPAELSFLESKKMAIDDIVALTNVPLALLGKTSGETFANADASIRIFLRETIKPLMSELTDILNWRLMPDTYELTFNDPTPEDQEQKRQDIETASNINALTTNEKRAMVGLEPVKNGDDILVPFSLTTLGSDFRTESVKEVKKKEHPLKDRNARRVYGESQVKKLDNTTKEVLKAVREVFRDQETRIIGYVEKTLKRKNIIDDAFNLDLEVRLAKGTLLPLIKSIFIKSASEHLELLDYNFSFNYSSIQEAVLSSRADLFSKSINETVFKKLQKEFKQSADNNETRAELTKRIKGVYDETYKNQALTIARTESHTALQYGIDQASKQAGMELKIWVWAPGIQGGVRDEHIAIDGEEVPINQPFSNGLMFPGDPSGDGAETINCECTHI